MFYSLGKPYGIKDLNIPSLKLKTIERRKIPIMIIDDEPFTYLEHIKTHRFDIEYFEDINSIESAEAYEIILCDIQGVGKKFKSKFQGAHVIAELRKKYPFKTIIAYTGYTHDPTFNRFFALADFSVKKDIDGDEWIDKLDLAIEIASDPKNKWIKVRDFLLEHNVPLFDIMKLENEYVKLLIQGKPIDTFPSMKLSNEISGDIRAVLQSFTASIIFKLIFG
jgi:DNA-binding NarL/FixJ family response regulator